MFIPEDKNVFYSKIIKANDSLFQGDILDAKNIGLKNENNYEKVVNKFLKS